MKLSKSGIFLIVVLVIAIGLGVWVAIMTCDVLAKDPITMPDRGSAAGTPRPVQNADKPKEPDTFVISMVGDCTLASIQTGRDFDSYIDKNGTSWPFSGVVDYLDQDEFTLANLECTFSDEKLKSSSLFYFRGPSTSAMPCSGRSAASWSTTLPPHDCPAMIGAASPSASQRWSRSSVTVTKS